MRRLTRILIFWAICAPLFYAFGLPYLMGRLQAKAQGQAYEQCQDQLKANNMAGAEASLLKPAQADSYCHCVSGGLILARADLPELARHLQPPRLTAAMKTVVDACNETLQAGMNQVIDNAPPPRVEKDANGVETVYFK